MMFKGNSERSCLYVDWNEGLRRCVRSISHHANDGHTEVRCYCRRGKKGDAKQGAVKQWFN